MSADLATSSSESNTRSAHLAAPETPVRLVTMMVGIVVGLTFLFGFGNVATLGIRLGVPKYVAFLVAPAVDFSVVALLLGTRHLALHDGPEEVIRSARRLLIFSSTVTLALNVAEPLIAGHCGKAAFDAVGPLLLIGWAETGPGLLQDMQTSGVGARPVILQAVGGSFASTGHDPAKIPTSVSQPDKAPARSAETSPNHADAGAREQDLLHRARAEDVLHWQQHHRPISTETLRKRLRVGAGTARRLVAQLRSDTHVTLDSRTPQPAAS